MIEPMTIEDQIKDFEQILLDELIRQFDNQEPENKNPTHDTTNNRPTDHLPDSPDIRVCKISQRRKKTESKVK